MLFGFIREVSKKGKRNYEKKRKMLPEKINPLVRTNFGVHFSLFHLPINFRFSYLVFSSHAFLTRVFHNYTNLYARVYHSLRQEMRFGF